MGILQHLILGLLHLALVAMDVLMLLVVARFLSGWWKTRWVLALEAAGRSVVNLVLEAIQCGLCRIHDTEYEDGFALVIGLGSLAAIRILIGAAVGLLT